MVSRVSNDVARTTNASDLFLDHTTKRNAGKVVPISQKQNEPIAKTRLNMRNLIRVQLGKPQTSGHRSSLRHLKAAVSNASQV